MQQRGWIWSRSVLWQNPGKPTAAAPAVKVASSWPLQQGLPSPAAAPILHDFPLNWTKNPFDFCKEWRQFDGWNGFPKILIPTRNVFLSKFNGGAPFGSPVLVRHGSLVEAEPFGPAPARGAHGPKKTGRFSSKFPVFRRFLVRAHPTYLKLTNPLYFLETMYYLIRVPERLFISFILFHFLLLCTSLFYVIFWFSQAERAGALPGPR